MTHLTSGPEKKARSPDEAADNKTTNKLPVCAGRLEKSGIFKMICFILSVFFERGGLYLVTTTTFMAKYPLLVTGLKHTTGARCLILLNRETLVPFEIRT